MSISTLLSVRGVVVSRCGSVSGGSRKHSLVLVRIPSVRLNVRGGRITVCAAPCESLEVVVKVGVRGVAFECSVLQCVKEGLVFQEARMPELIRVAAYLRALSFYTYPEGRTEEALKVMPSAYNPRMSLCFGIARESWIEPFIGGKWC